MIAKELAEKYLQPFKIADGKVQPKFCPFAKGGHTTIHSHRS